MVSGAVHAAQGRCLHLHSWCGGCLLLLTVDLLQSTAVLADSDQAVLGGIDLYMTQICLE